MSTSPARDFAAGRADARAAEPQLNGSGSAARTPEVVAFEKAVVDYFVEAADLLGIPKSVASIYGICFASPEPLGFSDIQERLELSAGSISQGLKVLKELGALKVAQPKPGESAHSSTPFTPETMAKQLKTTRQRERYEPDMQLRKLAVRWMEDRLHKQLDSRRLRLDELINSLPTASQPVKSRLGHLRGTHAKVRALLPLIRTFLSAT